MKLVRTMGILLALLLCIPATAWAEGTPGGGEVFEDTWVCGRASIDIDETDGGYRVEIAWGDSASVSHEWRYDCAYDEGAVALVGVGEKHIVTYGEDGEVVEDEMVYTGGEATFALDGEGRLLWADAAEDAGDGLSFERMEPEGDEDGDDDEADPAGRPYVGEWACDRATLVIGVEDGDYVANVRWASSAFEVVEWVYDCAVGEAGLVSETGEKYVIACNDRGLEVSSTLEYEDGAAVFALTADGALTWQDAVEDAGAGMAFERVESAGE